MVRLFICVVKEAGHQKSCAMDYDEVLNDYICHQEDMLDAIFWKDGVRELMCRTIPEWLWEIKMNKYMKARWWIFSCQN